MRTESSGDSMRSNFDALALLSPTVKTDSNGHAVVDIKLPDNLTRIASRRSRWIAATGLARPNRRSRQAAADGPAEQRRGL